MSDTSARENLIKNSPYTTARQKLAAANVAVAESLGFREDVRLLAQSVLSGYDEDYVSSHDDPANDEQRIYVRMALGDYRRARRIAAELATGIQKERA